MTPLTPEHLKTLRHPDDTRLLALAPVNSAMCRRLCESGLVSEQDGWWHITPMGREVLNSHDDRGAEFEERHELAGKPA